jgi:glucose-6-phosphate 1-epimerase
VATLQELNDRFRIPGVAEVISDRGGLPAVWVEGSNVSHGASATIYLHGGHVASWRPKGAEDVLWVSDKSHWQDGKAIRGGVPICFPWFGPHPTQPSLPAHGFARLKGWRLESLEKMPMDMGLRISLVLESDNSTRALWPHEFLLRNTLQFGAEGLRMHLELTNRDKNRFSSEIAQHSYFAVGDVRQVRVTGLEEGRYIDKTDGMKRKPQTGPVTITAETDRIYLTPAGEVFIEDPVKRRRIRIRKASPNTVVWNPWIDKAKAMADFGDEEWPRMLCVETAKVGDAAVTVAPGETEQLFTELQVQSL